MLAGMCLALVDIRPAHQRARAPERLGFVCPQCGLQIAVCDGSSCWFMSGVSLEWRLFSPAQASMSRGGHTNKQAPAFPAFPSACNLCCPGNAGFAMSHAFCF